MLLYTKLAPPKVAKKRSRSGCAFCRDKKKKCDEVRPTCSRCLERGVDCVYEGVKPRRRRSEATGLSKHPPSEAADSPGDNLRLPGRRLSSGTPPWPPGLVQCDSYESPGWMPFDVTSPIETVFTGTSLSFSAPEYDAPDPDQDADEEVFSEGAQYFQRGYSMDAGSGFIVPYSPSRSGQHPDLAMIAPCAPLSPLLEFCAPAFSEFTDKANRRVLINHFCNTMSHLIVLGEGDGKTQIGNPFQQLVLPLADRSPCVKNAVYALAGAHLEHKGIESGEKALYFHQQAVQGLAKMIDCDDQLDRNEMLASIILLVYYEVLLQKGRSSIVDGHLKGALTVMHDRKSWASDSAVSDPTSAFLETAFRFFDVITALSHGTSPLSPAPAAGYRHQPSNSPLGIDSLLGMAATLWPIIHRLSSLAPLKRDLAAAPPDSPKAAVLRTEFMTTASAVEAALLSWQPPMVPPPLDADRADANGNGGGDVDHQCTETLPKSTGEDEGINNTTPAPLFTIVHNAVAYRHAALTTLYRTILPRKHASATPSGSSPIRHHAHLTLEHCVAAAAHAGPMGALLWPMFTGACEAVGEDERELARRAFGAVQARQGMVNIGQAWEVVVETWRRIDEGMGVDAGNEAKETGTGEEVLEMWRRVGRDMGVDIVFG